MGRGPEQGKQEAFEGCSPELPGCCLSLSVTVGLEEWSSEKTEPRLLVHFENFTTLMSGAIVLW